MQLSLERGLSSPLPRNGLCSLRGLSAAILSWYKEKAKSWQKAGRTHLPAGDQGVLGLELPWNLNGASLLTITRCSPAVISGVLLAHREAWAQEGPWSLPTSTFGDVF